MKHFSPESNCIDTWYILVPQYVIDCHSVSVCVIDSKDLQCKWPAMACCKLWTWIFCAGCSREGSPQDPQMDDALIEPGG